MKLTNIEIYQTANKLLEQFDNLEVYIPAKTNFYIQKNIALLTAAAQDIEKARIKVAEHYGEKSEKENTYSISPEKAQEANKELEELFLIEQELDIKKFSIDDLGKAEFTPAQMQALMIMIED